MLIRYVTLSVLLATAGVRAAPVQLLPVDEAAKRPEFFSFRAQLQQAIARHDAAALLAAVDPNIKNSFGGNDGIDEFRTMWRTGEADSEICRSRSIPSSTSRSSAPVSACDPNLARMRLRSTP